MNYLASYLHSLSARTTEHGRFKHRAVGIVRLRLIGVFMGGAGARSLRRVPRVDRDNLVCSESNFVIINADD